MIKDQEGYHKALPDGRCTTYYCPAGVLTIGYGSTNLGAAHHNIHPGDVWTKDQAEEALRKDMQNFEEAVETLVKVDMTQGQFDALVSFTYNCGEGALGKSTLLRKFNSGDTRGAAEQFQYWNKGGGRILPGLVTRRAKEKALFLSQALMPQAVTKTKTFWDYLTW